MRMETKLIMGVSDNVVDDHCQNYDALLIILVIVILPCGGHSHIFWAETQVL